MSDIHIPATIRRIAEKKHGNRAPGDVWEIEGGRYKLWACGCPDFACPAEWQECELCHTKRPEHIVHTGTSLPLVVDKVMHPVAGEKGPLEDDIRAVCAEVAEMLCEKNRKYGNSAIEPVRIFSKSSPVEQILVRIDDKISRLVRGESGDEDVEQDLIGYLILLRIARRKTCR